MIIGNKQGFAIELEILDVVDGWIFGTFVFWILGFVVGNLDDKSVDLKGCINWLRDLIENRKNRFEPGLYELEKEQAYIQLCSSVLAGEGNFFSEEKYSDTFSRFHISHVGMSSFGDVTIVLIENRKGLFRCIWKQGNQEIKEAFFDSNELYKVAADTIVYFKNATTT